MKINEIEALVGISKKNIRFYEEQGLLSPRRNAENSYREYGEADIQTLRRIRLLRKLGVPIGEIRRMLDGVHTVADSMRIHLIDLERERRNLDQSIAVCEEMCAMDIPVQALDAEAVLLRMEEMEKGGTCFRNHQKEDIRSRYIAPVAVAGVMFLMIGALTGLLIWAYRVAPENAPPSGFVWMIIGLFAAAGGGMILALMQRIREIRKGEIDDAKQY